MEVLRQDHIRDQALGNYERDLENMAGVCLYYPVERRIFENIVAKRSRRFDRSRAKTRAYQARKKETSKRKHSVAF